MKKRLGMMLLCCIAWANLACADGLGIPDMTVYERGEVLEDTPLYNKGEIIERLYGLAVDEGQMAALFAERGFRLMLPDREALPEGVRVREGSTMVRYVAPGKLPRVSLPEGFERPGGEPDASFDVDDFHILLWDVPADSLRRGFNQAFSRYDMGESGSIAIQMQIGKLRDWIGGHYPDEMVEMLDNGLAVLHQSDGKPSMLTVVEANTLASYQAGDRDIEGVVYFVTAKDASAIPSEMLLDMMRSAREPAWQ